MQIAEPLAKTILTDVANEGHNEFIAAIGLSEEPKDYTEYFKNLERKIE